MKTFMQKIGALGVIALMVFSLLSSNQAQAGPPGGRVSFQVFYDELSPYGRWINDPDYGYVWSPRVEMGFQPYATRGHWVMTEYGNTWVSDYDWGWAPFHYGRWMYDDFYGWLWVPGNEWGPAWVDWRHSNGYYGWAPMGPRVTYVVPVTRWVFVPVMYITSPRIYSYCVPRTQVVNIYHNTTIINNYYERDNRKYVYGPRTQDIERATNRRVEVRRLENDSRPGRTAVADNSVRIYRPEVETRRREAPARAEATDSRATRTRVANSVESPSRTDRSSTTGRTRLTESNEDITKTRTSESREEYGRSRTESGTETPSRVVRERSTRTQPDADNSDTFRPRRSQEAPVQTGGETYPATRQRQYPASTSPATTGDTDSYGRRSRSEAGRTETARSTETRTGTMERQQPVRQSRQEVSPTPAPTQRQVTPRQAPLRQESSPARSRESSRGSRN
ncbi:DUF6600 domain-containing protein [Rufibacter roseus]|uniref:DUF6600 domain-containing protein n=1 Tax=Rufibacter roseus TaxID=1567108 RepID=A0ABW2DMR4_9BACT|nr:DUF6600 domain-containing protein [Rufibacter roseus]